MQESLAKENVSLDEMMAEVVALRGRRIRASAVRTEEDVGTGATDEETLRGRCAYAHRPCCDTGKGGVTSGSPVPPAVPGEFVVRLGEGCDGPLLKLVKEMDGHGLGAGAAATMLLSWLEFVRAEVEGVEECRDLVEGLRRLRGAVMAAGACHRGSIGGIRTS